MNLSNLTEALTSKTWWMATLSILIVTFAGELGIELDTEQVAGVVGTAAAYIGKEAWKGKPAAPADEG